MTEGADRSIEIVELSPDRWDDIAALFGEGGDPKTCWCMFWRLRSRDWSFANAGESRERFLALVDAARDPAPGLLAFEDGRAIGWVSIGPRADYERLEHSKVRPAIDDTPVWSIVCFVVSRTSRRRGLTRQLLDAAVAYARDHGAPAVEAYPVRPAKERIPAALGYTGLLSTFEAAGFEVVREIDSPQATVRRVIVRRDLTAPPGRLRHPSRSRAVIAPG
jgi:GNAT superfamily N-acetyltransferase